MQRIERNENDHEIIIDAVSFPPLRPIVRVALFPSDPEPRGVRKGTSSGLGDFFFVQPSAYPDVFRDAVYRIVPPGDVTAVTRLA